ncbi:MAG: PA2169 family four-helix-bundle protein [Phycisphaerales bacterium]
MKTLQSFDSETIDGLKKLVRMNHDAAKGFDAAADRADRSEVRTVLKLASQQRERFEGELMSSLEMTDADVPEGGSALGLFHRCWLNVRAAINGGDTAAVLAEATRGEGALVDAYEEVLSSTGASPVDEMLRRQFVEVKETRDHLEALGAAAK